MNAKAYERLILETSLRKALEREEIVVFGLEALARWKHPELGLVSPTQFIPIAEETGLIVPIGDWMMRRTCI